MTDFKAQAPRLAAILLFLLILGVAVVLGTGFYQQASYRRKIVDARENLVAVKAKLEKMRTQQEQNDNEALKLGTRPPGWDWGDQMPVMVMQVTAIVEGRGYKVATLKPDRMSTKGSVLHFPLRIGLRMDLAGLSKVLDDLRDTLPLLAVERLSVRNDKGKDGKLAVEMTIGSYVVTDSNAPLMDVGAVLEETTKEPPAKDAAKTAKTAKAAETKPEKTGGKQ